jgi:hypothetical protein
LRKLVRVAVFVDIQAFPRFDAGDGPANQGCHFSLGGFANRVPFADASRRACGAARASLGFVENAEVTVEVI